MALPHNIDDLPADLTITREAIAAVSTLEGATDHDYISQAIAALVRAVAKLELELRELASSVKTDGD